MHLEIVSQCYCPSSLNINNNKKNPVNFLESQPHVGFSPVKTEVYNELNKRNEFHLIFLHNEMLDNN